MQYGTNLYLCTISKMYFQMSAALRADYCEAPGDGNCLYYAVDWAIRLQHPKKHLEYEKINDQNDVQIFKAIIKTYMQRRDWFDKFLTEDNYHPDNPFSTRRIFFACLCDTTIAECGRHHLPCNDITDIADKTETANEENNEPAAEMSYTEFLIVSNKLWECLMPEGRWGNDLILSILNSYYEISIYVYIQYNTRKYSSTQKAKTRTDDERTHDEIKLQEYHHEYCPKGTIFDAKLFIRMDHQQFQKAFPLQVAVVNQPGKHWDYLYITGGEFELNSKKNMRSDAHPYFHHPPIRLNDRKKRVKPDEILVQEHSNDQEQRRKKGQQNKQHEIIETPMCTPKHKIIETPMCTPKHKNWILINEGKKQLLKKPALNLTMKHLFNQYHHMIPEELYQKIMIFVKKTMILETQRTVLRKQFQEQKRKPYDSISGIITQTICQECERKHMEIVKNDARMTDWLPILEKLCILQANSKNFFDKSDLEEYMAYIEPEFADIDDKFLTCKMCSRCNRLKLLYY